MKTQHRKRGQALVEYALIIALVAIVAIAALHILGTKTSTAVDQAGDALTCGRVACGHRHP